MDAIQLKVCHGISLYFIAILTSVDKCSTSEILTKSIKTYQNQSHFQHVFFIRWVTGFLETQSQLASHGAEQSHMALTSIGLSFPGSPKPMDL